MFIDKSNSLNICKKIINSDEFSVEEKVQVIVAMDHSNLLSNLKDESDLSSSEECVLCEEK